jgi:hypothetical protein
MPELGYGGYGLRLRSPHLTHSIGFRLDRGDGLALFWPRRR